MCEVGGIGILKSSFADFFGGVVVEPEPGLVTVNGGGARKDGEATSFHFDKFNRVAGFQSKLFSNVEGKSNSTVEGNHC